jgi:hypothetical protein
VSAPETEGELYERLQAVVEELRELAEWVDVATARQGLQEAATDVEAAQKRWLAG